MLLLSSLSSRPKTANPIYRVVDAVLRHSLRAIPIWPWTEHLALWWGYRFRPDPRVITLRSGALIRFSRVDHLQLLLYYLGVFEPHCMPYLRGCATPGGTVVDIGANIGTHTLESSLAVGPQGRVISIEAAPPHVAALRENLALNGIANVTVVESAVSDRSGVAALTLPTGGNYGMFTLGPTVSSEGYSVCLRTLDDLLEEQQVRSVDLIKMDIEGSEYKALCGASKTLARYKPAVLMELNASALARSGSSAEAIKGLLRKAGYRGWVIRRRGAQPLSSEPASHDCDECLFIHSENDALVRKLELQHPAAH